MRRLLIALVGLLGLPVTATAAPTPVARADAAVLSGDRVVAADARGRTLTVRAYPVAGGAPTTLLEHRAPGALRPTVFRMGAGDGRAGVVVQDIDSRKGFIERQTVYAGGLDGPWASVPAPDPGSLFFRGDDLIVERLTGGFTQVAPDGTQTPADLPERIVDLRFAGDLMAYTEQVGNEVDELPASHLVLRNWRTGETLRDETLDPGSLGMDLRADGSIVVDTDGAGLRVFGPDGGPSRRLAPSGPDPTWAGDRVVVRRDTFSGVNGLGIVDADGRRRGFGIASAAIGAITADAERVVWQAHGCAYVAAVTDGRAARVPRGPCRGAELILDDPVVRRRGDAVRVRLRCLSAPRACAGAIRGRGVRTRRYRIPAGGQRAVALRLTGRAADGRVPVRVAGRRYVLMLA